MSIAETNYGLPPKLGQTHGHAPTDIDTAERRKAENNMWRSWGRIVGDDLPRPEPSDPTQTIRELVEVLQAAVPGLTPDVLARDLPKLVNTLAASLHATSLVALNEPNWRDPASRSMPCIGIHNLRLHHATVETLRQLALMLLPLLASREPIEDDRPRKRWPAGKAGAQ